MQAQLGVVLLVPEGRRRVPTPAGEALLGDARPLLGTAFRLERRARMLQQSWEAEVRLAVDGLCPTGSLLDALVRGELVIADEAGAGPAARTLAICLRAYLGGGELPPDLP